MAIDVNDVIEDGDFAGLTVEQLMSHTRRLTAAVNEGRPPAAPPAQPPAQPPRPDPAKALEEAAKGRVDNATFLTWMRLEQDDEAAFAATASDYDKYKEQIATIKKTLQPEVRITRGLHKRLYENIKLSDPAVQSAIYQQAATAPPVADPPPPAAPPPAPPPAESRRPGVAPPTAPPTPAGRASAQQPAKPKLKATGKIAELARISRKPLEEYLLQLEEQGYTQDDLERMSSPRQPRAESAAFNRRRA